MQKAAAARVLQKQCFFSYNKLIRVYVNHFVTLSLFPEIISHLMSLSFEQSLRTYNNVLNEK